jgi:peptidoglycan/LPS O-acetylase OafA/YrhL
MSRQVESTVGLTKGGPLDALRFLAAAFILVFHFGDNAPVRLRDMHDFFGRGYLATDFFLLLSGFVLARVYGGQVLSGRVSSAQFLAKRLARIYPAHLITLAVLVVLVLAGGQVGWRFAHPERFDWSALPAHLLLMHGWGLAPDTWNLPTWSISALAACYFGFPWTWRLLRLLGTPLACVLVALSVVVGSDLLAQGLTGQHQFSVPMQWGLLRAIPLFVVGLTLARLVEVLRIGAMWARAIAASGALVFLVSAVLNGPDLVSVLAIMAVVTGLGAEGRSPAWPGAAWAAKISFSLFITHIPAAVIYFDALQPILAKLPDGALVQWTVWSGALLFALGMAAAFHYGLDEPLQRRLRTTLFSPQPAPRPAPAQ